MNAQINTSILEIQCENYQLRGLRKTDVKTFYNYLEINGNHPTIESVQTMLEQTIQQNDTLAIFDQDQLIGAIQWITIEEELPIREKAKGLGIGYSIRKDLRNHGIMQKTLKAVINTFRAIDYFYAYTTFDNLASIQVLKKNGFVSVKEDEVIHWMFVNEEHMLQLYLEDRTLTELQLHHLQSNLYQTKGPYTDEYLDFKYWYKKMPSRQETFMHYLSHQFGLKKEWNILEVGGGRDATLSMMLAQQGYRMTCVDPFVQNHETVKTIQGYFDYQTFQLEGYDCVIAQEPCEATEHIVRACWLKKIPFVIVLCGTPHQPLEGDTFTNTIDWYVYLRTLTHEQAHFEILDFGLNIHAVLLVNP